MYSFNGQVVDTHPPAHPKLDKHTGSRQDKKPNRIKPEGPSGEVGAQGGRVKDDETLFKENKENANGRAGRNRPDRQILYQE